MITIDTATTDTGLTEDEISELLNNDTDAWVLDGTNVVGITESAYEWLMSGDWRVPEYPVMAE